MRLGTSPVDSYVQNQDAELHAVGRSSPYEHRKRCVARASVSPSELDSWPLDNPLSSTLIPNVLELVDGDTLDDHLMPTTLGSTCGSFTLHMSELEERWDVNKHAVAFLSSVVAFSRLDEAEDFNEMPHVIHAGLRMEKPMLAYDTELELRQLRSRNVIHLSSRDMSPYPLDVDADEAMLWPARYLDSSRKKDDQIANERLTISKDAVELLKSVSHPEPLTTQEVETAFLGEVKARFQRSITPPLLPLSPPMSLLRLPNVVQRMDLTSSPEDLIAVEAAELDRQIMARDDHDSELLDIMTIVSSPALDGIRYFTKVNTSIEFMPSPSHGREHFEIKAEIPLLPASPLRSLSLPVPEVSLPASLLTLVPAVEAEASALFERNSYEDIDAFMNKVIIPLAEPAIIQSEREKLVELDTTMRVVVPVVHDCLLVPPWKMFDDPDTITSRLDAQRVLLRLTRIEQMKDIHRWGGVSKLEKSLPWCAFPARSARVDVEELSDDGSAKKFVDEIIADTNLDFTSLVPTMSKLVLPHKTTDEDELEPLRVVDDENNLRERSTDQIPPKPQHHDERYPPQVSKYFGETGITGLAMAYSEEGTMFRPQSSREPECASPTIERTRKVSELLSSTSKQAKPSIKTTLALPDVHVPQSKTSMRALLAKRKLELETYHPNKKAACEAIGITSKPPALSGDLHNLSNGSGLANFLCLQGGEISSLAEVSEKDESSLPCTNSVITTAVVHEPPPIIEQKALRIPRVIKTHQMMHIVFSPQMFAERALIRELSSLLPNMAPIERSSLTTSNGTTNTRPQHTVHAEADMVLSPSTGLILTTLQKLKQRPLPGQTSFHGVREHVSVVARSYETLVVLVHDARPTPSLDDNDTDALCDFLSFTLSLPTATQVLYVADSLEKWLAAIILQHAIPHTPETRLLPDETTWERFLRVAGMNAFAAQVVLNQLKAPDAPGLEPASPSAEVSEAALYGLAAFLCMSLETRVQQLGDVLGGRRVLERVSAVVDGKWQAGLD